jgi:methylmalonyl-CoA mutase C-terminal domain/subunit
VSEQVPSGGGTTDVRKTAPRRILLAKIGLDGHDRGIRLVARELRERGAEVILLGLGATPQIIARAALEEDVDVIAVSILSGAHMAHIPRLIEWLDGHEAPPPIVCGGLIPASDVPRLLELGVREVAHIGMSVEHAADRILEAASQYANSAH